MTNPLIEIDPAFEAIDEFSRHSSGTTPALHGMRQKAIFSGGVLPAKTKVLGALLWAVSAKCEPCLKYYARQAKRHGATKEQVGEMLGVASTMGGCVGEMWATKAFHAYSGHREAAGGSHDPSCCAV